MKKKIIIYIFVLFLCIGAVVGIYCYRKLNQTTYCLNLPTIDDISNTTLEQNAKGITINDIEEIKEIIEVLNAVKRVTNQKSIQDIPVNVEDEIRIDFELKDGKKSTVYVYKKNNKYYIEQAYNGIYRISADEYNAIEKYFRVPGQNMTTEPYIPNGMSISNQDNTKIPVKEKEYNRSPDNVIIQVVEDTITNESVSIIITDNNEDYYGWGVEFKVQKKVNNNWEVLEPVTDELTWISIAYLPNEDKQIKQKLNIKEYYGKLNKGIYRIIKPVYDNGYIDLYSNEFEIK